ncbi:hypothetical protein UFOVP33_38 [uncultured Caudovirales phage]|uniref:Uncharacterized protein n=1 Tax=uncultured Caudovirales phage TaxID=2100421 RepID=A0A6J5KNB0_9CAUD|nr:hypothetical protein UFOVP33_38 [uncultured Caudovirales phage]
MTKKTICERVQAALLAHPEGLCIAQIVEMLESCNERQIQNLLRRTYGFYIQRFEHSPETGAQRAVWCCVPVPKDAKRMPSRWHDKQFRQQYMQEYRLKRMREEQEAKIGPPKPPKKLVPIKRVNQPPKTRWAFPPPWTN